MKYEIAQLSEQVLEARANYRPVLIQGGSTKSFYGNAYQRAGEEPMTLDMRSLKGIVNYEPTELVMTAMAGTPLQEIIDTFARRLDNHPDFEVAECLRNIHRIAEIRLADAFGVSPEQGNRVWDWAEALATHTDPGYAERGQLTVTYLTDAHRACAAQIMAQCLNAGAVAAALHNATGVKATVFGKPEVVGLMDIASMLKDAVKDAQVAGPDRKRPVGGPGQPVRAIQHPHQPVHPGWRGPVALALGLRGHDPAAPAIEYRPD